MDDSTVRALCVVVGFAVSLQPSSFASANDHDLRVRMVPAASCFDRFPARFDSFRLRSSTILLATARITPPTTRATIRVVCPLPVTAAEISSSQGDNDLTAIRVRYQASDGLGTGVGLEVRLIRVSTSPAGLDTFVVCGFSSNLTSASTGATSVTVPCGHDVDPDSFYNFEVVLGGERSATGQSVQFAGIDFPPAP
jgi:hypothetical protein